MDLMDRLKEDRRTVTVTDVWGRSRDAEIYQGAYSGCDGFACPFCASVTVQHDRWPRCQNPWCCAREKPSDPVAPAFRAVLLTQAHEEALREDAHRWRERIHEDAMRRLDKDREARRILTEERRQRAVENGQCVRCAIKDFYRPKFIRHRNGKDCGK